MTSQSRGPFDPMSQAIRWLKSIRSSEIERPSPPPLEGQRTTEALLVGGPLDEFVVPIVRWDESKMPDSIPLVVFGLVGVGEYYKVGITDEGRYAYWWMP